MSLGICRSPTLSLRVCDPRGWYIRIYPHADSEIRMNEVINKRDTNHVIKRVNERIVFYYINCSRLDGHLYSSCL